MRILLTNDDGYQARGIQELYKALSEVADVTIVAPDGERSATGMAITLAQPLRATDLSMNGFKGYSLSGTPADCIKFACSEIFNEEPDFIFSGINHGSNVGMNALYSGTVAGAIEGALMGIPAIALSVASHDVHSFEAAKRVAREVVKNYKTGMLSRYKLLNINVPNIPENEIKGMKVTRMSHVSFREVFHKRVDTREREYYWMGGEPRVFDNIGNGDDEAVENGYVSITPLYVDITDNEIMDKLRNDGWEQDWR